MKKNPLTFAAAALALLLIAPLPGFAQNLTSGAIYVAPDHSMSVKSMIGAPIYNDQHQKIGTIYNVMVKPEAAEAMVVLSIGDFLGTGPKTIAVPLSHLKMQGNEAMTMADASKDSLSKFPTYNDPG